MKIVSLVMGDGTLIIRYYLNFIQYWGYGDVDKFGKVYDAVITISFGL